MSKNRSKARTWRRPTVHLLRKLPPSTGQRGDAAEINYFVDVTISGRNIPNEWKSSTRDIFFYPLSEPMPYQEPLKEQQSMPVSPRALECPTPLSYQIDIHLLNGPCLILHQPIPLTITITKIGEPNCLICLNDFQTMLVETTHVQTQGVTESFTRFWVVQSTANMNIGIDMDNAPSGSIITLPDGLWASQPLPAMLTPSFEICNIKRSYKLQIRLGLRLGLVRYQTLVRDFHFPVYVMAPNSTGFESYEREPSIDLIDFK
ncbi:hypothetical protein MW887_006699 [Aspergillus wentii]|nr:hypothetical protein MW887_006699 [Aspergillus wentii]